MGFVWSITKWRDYEQCEVMAYNKHVLRNFVDKPGPAMERGREAHKAFENAVKHGVRLPDEFAQWDSAIEAFDGRPDVFTEYKFGLDKSLQHTNFFSDGVWIRCVLDVFVSASKNPLLVDYKTGWYKDEHKSDAEFYGACTVKAYGLPRIEAQYWYLDNPAYSFGKTVEAKDVPSILMSWAQLFQSAEVKFETSTKLRATAGKQCKWCQVKTCPNYRGE